MVAYKRRRERPRAALRPSRESHRIAAMQHALIPSLLLLTVLVLNPFLYASSLETWTKGISDAESDSVDQAIDALAAVVSPLASTTVFMLVVVGDTRLASETATVAVDFVALPPRAPPLV